LKAPRLIAERGKQKVSNRIRNFEEVLQCGAGGFEGDAKKCSQASKRERPCPLNQTGGNANGDYFNRLRLRRGEGLSFEVGKDEKLRRRRGINRGGRKGRDTGPAIWGNQLQKKDRSARGS